MLDKKITTVSTLLQKLYEKWLNNEPITVLMYSTCITVGFSDMKSKTDLKEYIERGCPVDMVLIKTSQDEYQLYLYELDSYKITNKELILKLKNGKLRKLKW